MRLQDEQWTKVGDFLRADRRAYMGKEPQCQQFVEAVIGVGRSGAQWRLLPLDYGNWNTIERVMAAFSQVAHLWT